MIVNAMTGPAIRREEKDRNALGKKVTIEPPKFAPLRWQSHLLVAAIVPICAGITAWYAAETWTRPIQIGVALSLAFAATAWLARAATPLAAIAGGILTAAMVLMGNGPGGREWFHSALLPLLTLFLLTLGATGFGRSKKESLGIAQNGRGRNAAQVVANLGTAALAGAFSLTLSLARNPSLGRSASFSRGTAGYRTWNSLCAAMLIAALGEATADTLSSELGEVLGGEPLLITTGERVAPGSDGAVSIAGTLAGIAGAILVVLVAVPTAGLTLHTALAAAAGAIGGLFFDSLLGATFERRSRLNNDAVNFLSTLAAALLALAILAL